MHVEEPKGETDLCERQSSQRASAVFPETLGKRVCLANCCGCRSDGRDISSSSSAIITSDLPPAMHIALRLVVLLCLVGRLRAQNLLSIQLLHAIGPDADFSPRGRLVVNTKELVSLDAHVLTDEEVTRLRDAANDTTQLYRVKAVAPTGSAVCFTRACAIVESSFNDIINVYLDAKGQFIGIGITSSNPTCTPSLSNGSRKKSSLSTSVNVVQTGSGPPPDTQSYVQRMEQEKLEKMKGDRGDNRSFLAKYWIYIVPLVIFMMISSASSPEGGGQ